MCYIDCCLYGMPLKTRNCPHRELFLLVLQEHFAPVASYDLKEER